MRLPENFINVELSPGTISRKREMVRKCSGKKALVKFDFRVDFVTGILNVKEVDKESFYLEIGDGEKRREERFYYNVLEELLVEK